MIKPKRLFFDLEVSPNIGFFWKAGYKLNIGYENIITEGGIICSCYKWEGEKEVYHLTWDKKQSDKQLLRSLIAVLNEADEIVAHNGDKFDHAWLRTRCLYHRIDMFPAYTTIDTLKVARSKFRFNSNRLDYIAQYLGVGAKLKTEYGWWKDIVLKKCEKSMNNMVKYCKEDVRVLERVYVEMKNHIPVKMHHAILQGGNEGYSKRDCPECGGHSHIQATRTTKLGFLRRQRKCTNASCGKYFMSTE
jgi:DNA polymerase elongation subunit (family B)